MNITTPIDIKNLIDIENFSQYSIPDYIPANTIETISNYYILRCELDITITLVYIDENTFQYRIRSPIEPLYKNIEITIYSYDKTKYDIITINPQSNLHYHYGIHKTSIYLYTGHNYINSSKIPLLIFQTDETNLFRSEHHLNAFLNLVETNSLFTYRFFNANSRKEWLFTHFDRYTNESYDRLFPGAYRADLFRYAYMYLNGGIYIDNKFYMFYKLQDIINLDNIVIVNDILNKSIYNAFFCSTPFRKEFLEILLEINKNIQNEYNKCPLSITGPKLFYNYFNKYSILLSHKIDNPNSLRKDPRNHYISLFNQSNNSNIIIAYCFYMNYYSENYNGGYDKLFHLGLLFRSKPIDIGNYIVYFDPHQFPDRFTAIQINNTIITKRIDIESGWGMQLSLILINKQNGKEYILSIGNSNLPFKQVSIEHLL